ncbi:hypothetical protein LWI28_003147 [Acer negundo]|uniref:Leucine-rich repeat-containing N-terminal plant-type domain-containing protein n=1 Tax=Acer negundo TaxID=4023 RepID=A0AAD5J3D8_ACENE|nr:hypothetical protein LWI28_003147 [Acer negundo]
MKYWKEDIDCCSWDGVTCDRVTGDVIGLDLSCSWLYGSIPSNTSLFLLFRLQKLNLAFNFFNSSHIPSDFVTFPSLTHLNLSSSYFSGQVPFQISHLSRLISLDLGTSWPSDHLTLETLVMERLVQNMTKLEQLILDNVNMSTAAPGYLINLSSSLLLLSLSDCELHGSLPENIFHLPNLQALCLPNNYNLKCDFPKVNWSSPLRYMDVSSTSSSGKLPDSFGNLKSLSYLNMENCSFIGSIPASIGNLTQLSYLYLGGNNFSGHIPSSLSNLEQLNVLRLFENNFSGEILDIFINLTQLSFLTLSSNSLSGSIPSGVGGLRNLVSISLDGNSLDGAIPSSLFALPSLEAIDLSTDFLLKPVFVRGFSGSLHLVLLLVLFVSWVCKKLKVSVCHSEGSKERFKNRRVLWNRLTLFCCLGVSVFNLILCLLSYFYWDRNCWSDQNLVTLLDLVLRTLGWGAICVYLQTQYFNSDEQKFPFLLRVWWGFYLFISCYCLVIDIVLYKKHEALPIQYLVSDIVSVITGLVFCYLGFSGRNEGGDTLLREPLLNGVGNGEGESIKSKGADSVTPFTNASPFSLLTFSWMGSLIAFGNKKTLDLEDIPQLDSDDSVVGTFPILRNKLEANGGVGRGLTTLKLTTAILFSV